MGCFSSSPPGNPFREFKAGSCDARAGFAFPVGMDACASIPTVHPCHVTVPVLRHVISPEGEANDINYGIIERNHRKHPIKDVYLDC